MSRRIPQFHSPLLATSNGSWISPLLLGTQDEKSESTLQIPGIAAEG